jgi:hypothetical protein
VIINVQVVENNVFLLAIYDKSEQDNITGKELDELLQFI